MAPNVPSDFTIPVNFNTQVEVTLTEYGAEIVNDQDKLFQMPDKLRANAKAGDVKKFQLWEIAQTFGPRIYMGNPRVPFEHNRINFRESDVRRP